MQAAEMAKETAEDAAAAAAAAAHLVQCMQDEADGLPPTGVASGAAAARSENRSALPAAEEAAVITEAAAVLAAAEEAGVLTEEGTRCRFGVLQTCRLMHAQQAGTRHTHVHPGQPSSWCHQCHAVHLCLGGCCCQLGSSDELRPAQLGATCVVARGAAGAGQMAVDVA